MLPVQGYWDIAVTDHGVLNATNYSFNVENANDFYSGPSEYFLQELEGGYWFLESMWIDSATASSMSFNTGSGFSIGPGTISNVLMSASGTYSGVWGQDVAISGNGFGEPGVSVDSGGTVSIGGQRVTVVSWSEEEIVVRIPEGDIDEADQSGVPVTITRSDGETREINVTFDNTDDSPAGTEQPASLNGADVPNDNGNTIAIDFSASSDDPSNNHNEEVMEYRIYRCEGVCADSGDLLGVGGLTLIATIDADRSASYSYVDRGVPQNNQDYTYYVAAVDKNGNKRMIITQGNRTVAQAIDESIDELELSFDPGDEQIGVSWNHDNEGGDVTYTICIAENSDALQGDGADFHGDGVRCIVTNNRNSYIFDELTNGNRYYFRGYAEDGEGNWTLTGIYYVDLPANLPESSILGGIATDIPTSLRLIVSMFLLAIVLGFANMTVIKNKVRNVLNKK
jgi:hypothetical protein